MKIQLVKEREKSAKNTWTWISIYVWVRLNIVLFKYNFHVACTFYDVKFLFTEKYTYKISS